MKPPPETPSDTARPGAKPGSPEDGVRRQLDRIVRRERGRLIADLVSRLGPARLDAAEDMAQEAIAAALSSWPYRGMPENPAAWLTTVARNKAFDRLRREKWETPFEDGENIPLADDPDKDDMGRLYRARVEDPELRLIFLCCHGDLPEIDRLLLTLQIVSGFSAREIASLFLMPETAIAQRLARTKRRLRGQGEDIADAPSLFEIRTRLDTVLKVLYLMFSLGYAPRSGSHAIRRDVADEALRLARILSAREPFQSPASLALNALFCFQASRFDAREAADGHLILLRDQDRTAWNRGLIEEGLAHLQASQSAAVLSRYHLEAGIAAIHATAPDFEACDWNAIAGLYRQLEGMTQSPVVTVNACAALAMAGRADEALAGLDRIADHVHLRSYAPYFIARAETLDRLGRKKEAAQCREEAAACETSAPVLRFLKERLAETV